jgi:5S rRNA maturation endonuclease (ribonuclease M5)
MDSIRKQLEEYFESIPSDILTEEWKSINKNNDIRDILEFLKVIEKHQPIKLSVKCMTDSEVMEYLINLKK